MNKYSPEYLAKYFWHQLFYRLSHPLPLYTIWSSPPYSTSAQPLVDIIRLFPLSITPGEDFIMHVVNISCEIPSLPLVHPQKLSSKNWCVKSIWDNWNFYYHPVRERAKKNKGCVNTDFLFPRSFYLSFLHLPVSIVCGIRFEVLL